jgi:hypothetical protein
MSLPDYIIIATIVLVVGAAAFYVWWAKKKGKKCIGCPYCDSCPSKGGSCGGEKK